jgi:N-acetylglutamate synthase-like GNAT family acetyltransferase
MFHIRAATPEDIPELQRLIELSVRTLSVGLYTPAQTEAALIHVFGVDTQLVADGTYYVIEEDTALVAAGGWSARQTMYGGDQAKHEADSALDPNAAPARIRAFFVHPAWTRRGLARQLFAKCEAAAHARGFRAFELVATLPGEPLYRALGFSSVEDVSIPLSADLVLPCVRMRRQVHVSDL